MSLIAATTLFGLKKTASPILGMLLGNWKEMIGVLLVAIIFYQNTFDTRVFFWADTIPYLRALTKEQRTQIDDAAAANGVLRSAIDLSNTQVDEYKAVSNQLEKENLTLRADRDNLREITRNQVKTILDKPTPQTCEAAMTLLRDALPSLEYKTIQRTP